MFEVGRECVCASVDSFRFQSLSVSFFKKVNDNTMFCTGIRGSNFAISQLKSKGEQI